MVCHGLVPSRHHQDQLVNSVSDKRVVICRAGASDESNLRAMQFALANLERLRLGRPLLSLVEPEFAPHSLDSVRAEVVETPSVRPKL